MYLKNSQHSLDSFTEELWKQINSFFSKLGLSINKGSMLRSKLCFIFGEENQINLKDLKKMAFCVEAIHQASLFIDDILDESQERRNAKPLYLKIGSKKALNAAFLLITEVISVVSKDFPFLTKIVLKTFKKMSFSELKEATQNNYFKICEMKTAKLFILSCIFPLLVGEKDYFKIQKVYSFAKNLGIVYQILDDIKDDDSPFETDTLSKFLEKKQKKLLRKIENLPVTKKSKIKLKTLLKPCLDIPNKQK